MPNESCKFVRVYMKSSLLEALSSGMQLPFIVSMSGEGPGGAANLAVGCYNQNGTVTILEEGSPFSLPVDITIVDAHGRQIHTHVPALGLRDSIAS